jgi:hypothetical protein
MNKGSARRKAAINSQNIHPWSRIGTHDPSVLAAKDSSCFRPRGHRQRPSLAYLAYFRVLHPVARNIKL